MTSLILFDDRHARSWEPFALTRPAGELRFGAMTLRERAERILATRCTALLAPDHLVGFEEGDAPPVHRYVDAPMGGERLFLSSRAVLAWGVGVPRPSARRAAGPVLVGGEVAGWYAPEGAAAPDPAFLDAPAANPGGSGVIELEGTLLTEVWELMARTPEQLRLDIAALFPGAPQPRLPDGVHRIGGGAVVLGSGVELEPGVVLDTRGGPIWLDDGAEVRAFTRLAGPAYVGRGSRILGGAVEAVSIGPVCRIRGEFAESVCLGWVNKAHDGHIGHAYLGAWVNLGAETTNSDLKNDYGTVKLWTPDGVRETGEMKIGSFLGDHVKTGIGLLLNTGTVVGAGSNLFGALLPPTYVPPFSWGTGDALTEYRVDKFLQVARRAMARRDVELTEGAAAQLRSAHGRARG
jgi:UDP-N-acetylglucosamine diphosphorylase / glucose-1-phosphate thymidylyltransferase / UDP-N-acetylgalactosamine diphosphorylase / glucosamine-1-phosphate N-acetyltransferase / galactosamine-1-phosphate N-acetyltransferase